MTNSEVRSTTISKKTRNHLSTLCTAFLVAAGASTVPACAEEGPIPYLAGVNLGIPIAASPPPGWYGSTTVYVKPLTLYNGNGKSTPIDVGLNGASLSLVYVPDVQILGGNYFAFVRQPVLFNSQTTDFFGHSSTDRESGIFNTIVSPFNVSWMLIPGELFVSADMVFYLKDSTYSRTASLNIGNNFWTFEPSAAVTYMHNGFQLTALALYDINTADNNSPNALAVNGNYQSGDIFSLEVTAVQKFDEWSVGVVGYDQTQTTDDTAGGHAVPALAIGPYLVSSNGNRASEVAVGPLVGYDFGVVNLTAYYTRDVYHENTIGGNSFWLRLSKRF